MYWSSLIFLWIVPNIWIYAFFLHEMGQQLMNSILTVISILNILEWGFLFWIDESRPENVVFEIRSPRRCF